MGNILQQLYNTADSLIVGHFLGTDAFASVGVSGSIMNLFIFILNGFCLGISVILGQRYGNGDHSGSAISVLVSQNKGAGICLFIGDADAQSIQYGIDYLRVVSLFYIFCFMGSALVGYFRGIGKVHVPFWCSTSHITIRVILSYLLVSRMGLPAVGLATGIGWIWAVTYQLLMYVHYNLHFRFLNGIMFNN